MRQPPADGAVGQPSVDGAPIHPPVNGAMIQPPGDGAVGQPSADGAPIQTPVDGAMIQPPADGAVAQPMENNSDNKPGCSSFLDIITVPQRPKRGTQKRKKMTNFNVTSDEHVSLISDVTQKSDAKKLKGKNPTKSLAKNKRKNLSAGKGKDVTPKTMLKSKKKNAASASGRPSTATSLCLYCSEADDITKWMQCQKCEMWAHYECAGADDTVFNWLCEFCE